MENEAIHPLATVHPAARVDPSAVVEADAMIGPGATIGRHATVGERVIVRRDAKVGEYARVDAGASVRQGAEIGPGAKVGIEATVGANASMGVRADLGDRAVLSDGVHVEDRATDAPPLGKQRPTPFQEGLLAGSDPVAEGRMGMYIAILPDADRGMPRRGVAPSHGQGARTGIGAPWPEGNRKRTSGIWSRRLVHRGRDFVSVDPRSAMYTPGPAPARGVRASTQVPREPR
ncbi:MAG: hypothetical protein OXL34_08960 [Gemmatimonadota bacterium]|nr:hypothetical protein [Gemmatimonadota bacterium]